MDKISNDILECLCDNPMSAKEISDYCNIPLPTVYRKLKMLYKEQMLSISGEIKNGVRNKLYRSKILKINA